MLRASMIGAGLLVGFAASSAALSADLTIWWTKGYYPAQDEGINRIVEDFQKDTGISVELALYTDKDIPVKLMAALEAGQPPDVSNGAAGFGAVELLKRFAHEGYLIDLSDIVEPVAKGIDPALLRSAYLLNGQTGRRAYYSLPIETASIHLHVWRSLLKQAGFELDNIPREWRSFWDFFCDAVQPAVRRVTGRRDIYGLGLPSSTAASDTGQSFEEFLLAHGAWFVDEEDKLMFDQPGKRQRIVDTLADFARFSQQGCNPPSAVNWADPDNNVSFLNQSIVMTPNGTLSIPSSQRVSNPENYYKNIATIPWPNGLNGRPLPLLFLYRGVEVYAGGHNQEGAKAFLRYLIQPERLEPFVEAAQGRFFPALTELRDTPFWTDPADPHRVMLRQQLTDNPRQRECWNLRASRWSRWRRSVSGPRPSTVLLEGWTPERAADEAIARTKEIVGQ